MLLIEGLFRLSLVFLLSLDEIMGLLSMCMEGGGISCELGKIALEHLVRVMLMVLLGYSLRVGPIVQPLSYSWAECEHVFVRFCFGKKHCRT